MQISIGDVVRDRADQALGTVAGVASRSDGNVLVVQLSGGGLRNVAPYDLEVVARRAAPMTACRSIAISAAVLIAIMAAFLGAQAERTLGAGWLLTLMVSLGSSTTVIAAFQMLLRMTGPRRIRL
ncbi:hypothetical protein [Kitasatospora camelliae]|uniref:Uncharacterized protein n=1 Tax=Kitasatospora camelliae TaxID=3156397 RepID=A0AAU8K1B1_9ACTN